jgi:hypothetical protein
LVQYGWEAFEKRDFITAEKHFSILIDREDVQLIGYYGLGWTLLKKFEFLNASHLFNDFILLNDDLQLFSATDTIFRDVRAGQTIAYSAMREHQQVIIVSNIFTATSTAINTWHFTFDSSIDTTDIRLFRAIAQYSISDFSASLSTIRLIDPLFDANVNTVEGRLMLAMKIEELVNS